MTSMSPGLLVGASVVGASTESTLIESFALPVSTVIDVTDESGPVTLCVPLPVHPAAIARDVRVIVSAVSEKV